jgi:diacylglycerol O-acyltransferase
MQRLTGLDAAFLALETPTTHMHVTATMVLDPSTAPGGFSVDTLKALINERLPRLAPLRRRLVPVPFQLNNPLWVDDPDFDIDYHVRRVALPKPGGMRELAGLTADIAGRQLDRSRPLWEMWLVEGLEHGHLALVAKLHHAAIDGVLGVELLATLFDLEPTAVGAGNAHAAWEPERVPSEIEMIVGAVASFATRPLKMAKALRNATRSAIRITQRVRNEHLTAGAPFNAPRTSFNGVITPHRTVAYHESSLSEIKEIKDAFGVTVNDVVLTVCAGALRTYLEARDEVPEKPLIAAIPASVRTETQRGLPGNRVSAMFGSLPVQLDDPAQRLRAVAEAMSGAKLVHDDVGSNTLQDWAEVAAPVLFARGARMYNRLLEGRHAPIVNLVLSNVPGPPFPLYCAGARLVSLFPLGPIMAGAGLNITVVSYLDSVEFGLIGCRELLPDLWQIADAVPDALAELHKAAVELGRKPAKRVAVNSPAAKRAAAKQPGAQRTPAKRAAVKHTPTKRPVARVWPPPMPTPRT